jgi:hypothetical protein
MDLMINVKQIFDDNSFHHLPVVNSPIPEQEIGHILKHPMSNMKNQ